MSARQTHRRANALLVTDTPHVVSASQVVFCESRFGEDTFLQEIGRKGRNPFPRLNRIPGGFARG